MKKMIASICVIALLLTGCLAVSGILQERSASQWVKLSDDDYRIEARCGDAPVLVKYLQSSDFQSIINELAQPGTETTIYTAKNAIENNLPLADNILEDGRILPEGWEDIAKEEAKNMTGAFLLGSNNVISKSLPEIVAVNIPCRAGQEELSFFSVGQGTSTVPVPQRPDIFPFERTMTPDGSKCILASDNGIYTVDGNGVVTQVSPETYKSADNSKGAYSNLENAETNIFWNSGITLGPGGQLLAYISNKENSLAQDVYTLNINNGTETRLTTADDGVMYMTKGWISDSQILCLKMSSNQDSFVLIGLDGKETELPITFDCKLLLVGNGILAYLDDSNIVICNYQNQRFTVTDTIYNAGISYRGVFSPDASKIAFDVTLEGEETYLLVYDVSAHSSSKLDNLPRIQGSDYSYISGFNFIDDARLIVTVSGAFGAENKYSTWEYTMGG